MEKRYSTINEQFLSLMQQFNKDFKIFSRVKLKKMFKEFHAFGEKEKYLKKDDQYVEIEKNLLLEMKKSETSLLTKLDSFDYKTQIELDEEIKNYIGDFFLSKKILCVKNFETGENDSNSEKMKVFQKIEGAYEELENLQKNINSEKLGLSSLPNYSKMNKGCQVEPKKKGNEIISVRNFF